MISIPESKVVMTKTESFTIMIENTVSDFYENLGIENDVFILIRSAAYVYGDTVICIHIPEPRFRNGSLKIFCEIEISMTKENILRKK